MDVFIKELKDIKIDGVKISHLEVCDTYKEDFFEWTALPLVSEFKNSNIMAGVLQGWHHTPDFSQIEYHEDKELFYFYEGTALMLFIDIENGKPVMETAQIVRIPAGTELEINQGKGHFVAVAENDKFSAMVISPAQDAPRLPLFEKIHGK